jgi:hypothetical protein
MTAMPKHFLKCSAFSATIYTKEIKFHVTGSVSDTKKANKEGRYVLNNEELGNCV